MQQCARDGRGVASCAWHVRSALHDGGVRRACTGGGARGGQPREVFGAGYFQPSWRVLLFTFFLHAVTPLVFSVVEMLASLL